MIDLIDSVDMVKFTKNGSSAVSAAVKLARAYTGRDLIARCAQHPFFSYDDWFISSTPMNRGVSQDSTNKTKTFDFNDISSLRKLIDQYPDQIACVVLEPATLVCPATENSQSSCCSMSSCSRIFPNCAGNFLQEIQTLCKTKGIVFILDEMITGFRWSLHGAQAMFDVKPDLSTFGKAMANGFSVACVAGKREIMSLGSIEKHGAERVFLLSTTHGAEMGALGAFVATVEYMKEHDVINHLWLHGEKLVKMIRRKALDFGISESFKVEGPVCSPNYMTLGEKKENSLPLRTLFSQEMIRNGVLMPWIALAYRHQDESLEITEKAIDATFKVYADALSFGVDDYLIGPSIKPVFRKYN
jgi:glutamate-1-semialdehyde 2,1-aminomutase